jgi:dienelactone hydrolase
MARGCAHASYDSAGAKESSLSSRPTGVPLQVHRKEGDELFLYPGEEHLFADSSLPGYDPDAADLLMKRVLAFLDAV